MKKELEVLDVVVVGAGALGSHLVSRLSSRGVRRVLIVDPDRLEERNLTIATMYPRDKIGQPKAATLAGIYGFEAFDGEIADLGWGEIEGRDLIFACVDRDSARLEIARISTRLGIPVCDGGIGRGGRVSYFPGVPEGACFGCRLTASRRRELLSTWRSQAYPCVEPVNPTSLRATLWEVETASEHMLKMAFGEDAKTFEAVDGEHSREFEMKVSELCPFHGARQPLVPFESGKRLGWEWPICIRARCQMCGFSWAPKMRRARLRICPSCTGSKILALECVDEMSEGAPEDIGLPANHRYTVRVANS